MARQNDTHHNDQGEQVSALHTDDGIKVWNHEHAVEIGTAQTEEDAKNMLNG